MSLSLTIDNKLFDIDIFCVARTVVCFKGCHGAKIRLWQDCSAVASFREPIHQNVIKTIRYYVISIIYTLLLLGAAIALIIDCRWIAQHAQPVQPAQHAQHARHIYYSYHI